MTQRSLFLGVEGGASKSTAMLADENLKVLKQSKGGPLNYQAIGEARAEAEMRKLLRPFLSIAVKRNTRLHAVFGLAGLNTKKDEDVYKRIARRVLGSTPVFKIYNDTKITLEAICSGEHKILVISGTGSNVYGESGKKDAKSGGWDFLVADEGSAFGAGMLVLRAAVKSWDGRAKKSIFEHSVPLHFRVSSMERAIEHVYAVWRKNPGEFKRFIASLSPLVDGALIKKDYAASCIREYTAQELALGVKAVAKKLGLKHEKVCVGMTGSNWKMPGLVALFKKEVKKHLPLAYFATPSESGGAYGALLLARKMYYNKSKI